MLHISSSFDDTDGAAFATLVDCLSAYPQASLGLVLDRMQRGDASLREPTQLHPLPHPSDGSRHRDKAAWPFDSREAALEEAWRGALGSTAHALPLPQVVRRTLELFHAVLEHGASGGQGAVLVKRVLSPLLSCLAGRSSATSSSEVCGARAAYAQVLPAAAAVLAQSCGVDGAPTAEGGNLSLFLWLWLQATGSGGGALGGPSPQRRCSEAGALLEPYISGVVEPLEKELRYLFRPGSETAKITEPQHFFTFLAELLMTRIEWPAAPGKEEGSNLGSTTPSFAKGFAQTALCVTAAAVFQETYQWQPTSPMLASSVFTVHTMNSLLDFMEQCESRVAPEAVTVLARYIAFPSALAAYLDAAAAIAARAFADAPRVYWRRAMLCPGSGGPLSVPSVGLFTARTVRLLRCLESQVRRLSNSLLLADPGSWRETMWERVVTRALGFYLSAAQEAIAAAAAAAEDDEGGDAGEWVALCGQVEVAEGLHAVATATEDWLAVLRTGGTGAVQPVTRLSAEALDEVVLLRDRLSRGTAEAARGLICKLAVGAGSGGAVRQASNASGLETFLRFMASGSDTRSATAATAPIRFILESVLRQAVVERFTGEQLASLSAYLTSAGLRLAGELLLP